MPRSVMEHSFSEVPRANIPRSSFNRSHGYKSTFDADGLVPVLVDDVVPGDTFNVNMSFFARLATPLFPIMDNMYLESFFFFVPYRLVWTNWERMHGEQDDPDDSIDFTVPALTTDTISTGDVADYMGIPLNIDTVNTSVSALPFRAYRLIWNDWFRDQNLQDSLTFPTDNGNDTNAEVGFADGPLPRGKRHDYFTSCLPWPQKGSTAVSLPLGTSAPLFTDAIDNEETIWGEAAGSGGTTLPTTGSSQTFLDTAGAAGNPVRNSATEFGVSYPDEVNVFADLSNATAATINDLRLAFQTQRLLERDARGGTRYNELILAHFGVTVPDFRLQRPEFLGGGSTAINVTPVAQTSGQPIPAANDKLGELAGFGTVSGTHGFTKSFVEHGVIIGLVNVRSDITYSQGLERYWSKQTRYDFFYPVLAQIGEQGVLNKEIWYADNQGTGASQDEGVFGYQERYAEYRYKPSMCTGLMRVDAASSLSAWHLSEDFASLPTLGDTFIQSNTTVPLDCAIAISSEPHFIFDAFFDMKCARPMPIWGVPGNLDHF